MAFLFKKSDAKKDGKTHFPPPILSDGKNTPNIDSESTNQSKKKSYFKASSGSKFSIIIGDDGAILLYIIDNEVQSRNFVAFANEENLKEFEEIILKDKKAPIYLIIDSMDQNFSQQSLPPISSLGLHKLIKKRINKDLPPESIKGYFLLEREETGRRDWNYLMVSLENSPKLNIWFNFIENMPNRLTGIYLLSIEVETAIRTIDSTFGNKNEQPKTPRNLSLKQDKSVKKTKPKNTGSKWKLFISHNKVGGFRQSVLKDGKAIFTRLTQPIGEDEADVSAGNIEQEMNGTIEYMKRMSLDFSDGLDIYIIASEEINQHLDLTKIQARNSYKFTPFELAEILNIKGATQRRDQFGDVILSAMIACSKKHRLILQTNNSKKINDIYNIIKIEKIIAVIMAVIMFLYALSYCWDLFNKYSEINELTESKLNKQRALDNINTEIKRSGLEVKKINDTVYLYQEMIKESNAPLIDINKLHDAIMSSVKIKNISWESNKPATAAANQPTPPAVPANSTHQPNINIDGDKLTVTLIFPEIADTPETFKATAKKIISDIEKAIPEYKASYTKLPDALSKKAESGGINFEDTNLVTKIEKKDLEATLQLVKLPESMRPQKQNNIKPQEGGKPTIENMQIPLDKLPISSPPSKPPAQ